MDKPIKWISRGETFGGRKGLVIGDCVYCTDDPAEAIAKYCNDEIHYCEIDSYTWKDIDTGEVIIG